jgi:hypothetical protein
MSKIRHINELLQFQDSHFISAAYQTLLGRVPDPEGMDYFLGRLRSGCGKEKIIMQLVESNEAKSRRNNINGLRDLIIKQRRVNHWIWGRIFRGNRIERQLNKLENELGLRCANIEQALNKSSIYTPNQLHENSFNPFETSFNKPIAPDFKSAMQKRNFASKIIGRPKINSNSKTPLEEIAQILSREDQ